MTLGGRGPNGNEAYAPFFDTRRLHTPEYSYVAWLDLMGTQNILRKSLSVSANFIAKVQVVAFDASREVAGLEVFPIIDGVYACSANQEAILKFLRACLMRLAHTFVSEQEPIHRFMPRSALAFGPIYRGADLATATENPERYGRYFQPLLIGAPLAQAFEEEHQAPPFGVRIHESARMFGPTGAKPMPWVYWRWWGANVDGQASKLARELRPAIKAHLEWCKNNSNALLYPSDKIDRDFRRAEEYFGEDIANG